MRGVFSYGADCVVERKGYGLKRSEVGYRARRRNPLPPHTVRMWPKDIAGSICHHEVALAEVSVIALYPGGRV